MSRKPGPGAVEPRTSDERFKTHELVSRVLTHEAETLGISKQDLLHRIAVEYVERKVHAARILLAAAGHEGMPGIERDSRGLAGNERD